MKRLTYRDKSLPRKNDRGEIVEAYSDYDVREIINRLAAYEDTGRTPEEVKDLDYRRLKEQEAKLAAMWGYGIEPDRLNDIVNAEREGRLIVLPCKLRDTVYIERHYVPEIQETKVDRFHIDSEGIYCITRNDDKAGLDGMGRFGRNVFLTRQEAEAAMAVHSKWRIGDECL